MLNEDDRRELSLIEEGLCCDDRRFADTFRTDRPRWRERRWISRALLGFGAFMMLVGMVASASGVFLNGLLVSAAGVAWIWLLRRRATAGERRSAGPPPSSERSSWDAPPEWYRPM
jgi:hypothetical protein